MDSGKATSADQARCSTKCLLASQALEPQHRPWADLPADILGVMVARLALLEDRARLRSVCHAWRAAARLHRRPPPPLPLLVLSDFSFSSFRAEGMTMTGARRRVPLPETETTAEAGCGRFFRCVGSIDGWLVTVERNQIRESGGDVRCFLVNPFSQDQEDIVLLPSPSATTHPADERSWSLPIANGGSGMVLNCAINAAVCVMSFLKVVLSSSPEAGTNYIAAAISVVEGTTKIALWRPGMKSWCVCYGTCLPKFVDVIFCQGKLYMISSSELTTDLFSLDLSDEDDNSDLMVSRAQWREIEWPDVSDGYQQNWSILEWRGKLLIIATYTAADDLWQIIVEVKVFEAHLSTDPVRFTEIKSLDGDCIFISPCNSRSFRSCHYDGVEADHLYFIDGYLSTDKDAHPFYKFVYNMRDGTMAPFASDIPKDKLRTPDGILMHPTWLFPPE